MSALNFLIVEDNLSFSLELEMLIDEIGYNVIARVDNSAEALETIMLEHPDFILMDVDIKGKLSGLQIGEKIKHLNIPILFITSYSDDEHYELAQRSNMIGYLVKPIGRLSLKTAINLAVKSLAEAKGTETNDTSSEEEKPTVKFAPKDVVVKEEAQEEEEERENFVLKDYLFFKKKDVYQKVYIQEILFIEADGDYIVVQLKDKVKYTIRMKFSDMEAKLPSESFMKVHRGYIIQLQKIESINFQVNTLKIDGHTIPISRSNKDKLSNSINKFS